MTVKELRDKLKDFDEDMQVVYLDDFCGWFTVEGVSTVEINVTEEGKLIDSGSMCFDGIPRKTFVHIRSM